jgi:hypothetical protein
MGARVVVYVGFGACSGITGMRYIEWGKDQTKWTTVAACGGGGSGEAAGTSSGA